MISYSPILINNSGQSIRDFKLLVYLFADFYTAAYGFSFEIRYICAYLYFLVITVFVLKYIPTFCNYIFLTNPYCNQYINIHCLYVSEFPYYNLFKIHFLILKSVTDFSQYY